MAMINLISKDQDYEDPRREFLVQLLSAGAFIAGSGLALPQAARGQIFGKKPYRMPDNKSIFDMQGRVLVNGEDATPDTLIDSNDLVETASDSSVVFVVGTDAFILRANSRLQLSGKGLLLSALRLFSGKLLSVFGVRNQSTLRMDTATATVGIRGTGVYAESETEVSYLCTCYGVTRIAAATDTSSVTEVTATHHNARYVLAEGKQGERITEAPFINHTDLELMLIEELVGRKTPFGIESNAYKSPRRRY